MAVHFQIYLRPNQQSKSQRLHSGVGTRDRGVWFWRFLGDGWRTERRRGRSSLLRAFDVDGFRSVQLLGSKSFVWPRISSWQPLRLRRVRICFIHETWWMGKREMALLCADAYRMQWWSARLRHARIWRLSSDTVHECTSWHPFRQDWWLGQVTNWLWYAQCNTKRSCPGNSSIRLKRKDSNWSKHRDCTG